MISIMYTRAHTHTCVCVFVMVVADVTLYMTYLLGDTIQPLACSEEIKTSDRPIKHSSIPGPYD